MVCPEAGIEARGVHRVRCRGISGQWSGRVCAHPVCRSRVGAIFILCWWKVRENGGAYFVR